MVDMPHGINVSLLVMVAKGQLLVSCVYCHSPLSRVRNTQHWGRFMSALGIWCLNRHQPCKEAASQDV